MKNQLLKLGMAAVFVFLGVYTSFGQTILESDQIFVRTYEMTPNSRGSQIIISYGEDRTEKIGLGSLKEKDWEFNTFTINKVLSNIRKAGYDLSTSNAGGGGTGVLVSSYVFVKSEDGSVEE